MLLRHNALIPHESRGDGNNFQDNFFHLFSFNSSLFLSSIQKVEVPVCDSLAAGGREQKCLAIIGSCDSYF